MLFYIYSIPSNRVLAPSWQRLQHPPLWGANCGQFITSSVKGRMKFPAELCESFCPLYRVSSAIPKPITLSNKRFEQCSIEHTVNLLPDGSAIRFLLWALICLSSCSKHFFPFDRQHNSRCGNPWSCWQNDPTYKWHILSQIQCHKLCGTKEWKPYTRFSNIYIYIYIVKSNSQIRAQLLAPHCSCNM